MRTGGLRRGASQAQTGLHTHAHQSAREEGGGEGEGDTKHASVSSLVARVDEAVRFDDSRLPTNVPAQRKFTLVSRPNSTQFQYKI